MSGNQSQSVRSRRNFLVKSVTATTGFYIVPRYVLGGRGYHAPSDRLNLAAIGAGGKGTSDIRNAANHGANNVVALCDVDFGHAKNSFEAFPSAKKYRDFRKMLDEMGNDIDAVTISTPDHTHAVAAMACMQLGKHVYVQKPLTHDIFEARMLTETARMQKVVTQMGNQGSSNPGQKIMIKWLEDGLIGKAHTVHVWTNRPVWPQGIPVPTEKLPLPATMSSSDWDLYIGTSDYVDYHPLFHHFKWRGWWNFETGALGDMGCHLIDPAFNVLDLGYPTEVECSVGQVFTKDWEPEYIPEGCPPSSLVQIKFPPSKRNNTQVTMYWYDGGLRPPHPEWIPANEPLGESDSANGVLIIGSKGVMSCGAYGTSARIFKKNGDRVELPEDDNPKYHLPEYGHQISWTEACKAGYGSPEHQALGGHFDYAGPLTETVLMGNLAIRSYALRRKNDKNNFEFYGRKKLLWDGQLMRITNFEEANRFVKRQYRAGWEI